MDTPNIKNDINYLIHELNSGVSMIEYALSKYDPDTNIVLNKLHIGVKNGLKKIKDIEDYFYKQMKEKELV